MRSFSEKKTVLVVGEGFAGRAAMRVLAGADLNLVVCGSGSSLFLPMLPDLVSGRIREEALLDDYSVWLSVRGGCLNLSPLVSLDPAAKSARFADGQVMSWDYCLLATGSCPAFSLPGAVDFAGLAGARSAAALPDGEVRIVGGGYTGVELAGAFARAGRSAHLIEAGPGILNGLPERVRKRVARALEVSGVVVHSGSGVEAADGGLRFGKEELAPERVLVAAGVKGATGYLPEGFVDGASGRVPVDACLRAGEGLYAVGDMAGYRVAGRYLRPSVNFAITQGRCAARNILREIRGKTPRRYRVSDPGYVVPVYSRGRAWGSAFGIPLGGRLGLLAHYAVCIIKAFSFRQGLRIFRGLLRFR